MGGGILPGSFWALVTFTSNSFRWIFPSLQVISLCTGGIVFSWMLLYIDRRGHPLQVLEFSSHAAPSLLELCHVTPLALALLDSYLHYFISESPMYSASVCLLHLGNSLKAVCCGNVRVHPISFFSLRDHSLQQLKSDVLQTILSYIL